MSNKVKVPGGAFYAGDGLTVDQTTRTVSAGGGSSVSTPDWNQNDETASDYIKNRPFYTGDPVETVLVEESTVSFTNASANLYYGAISTTIELAVGETYEVSWDGAVYECVCKSVSGFPVIGNPSIIGAGADTGEPFVISPLTDNHGTEIYTLDTSASHAISISRIVAPVVKIDEKYLPVSTDGSYGVIKKSDIVSVYNFPANAPHDQMVEAIAAFNTGNASIVWDGSKVINASYYSSSDRISVTFADEPLNNVTFSNNNGSYVITLGTSTYAELQGSKVRIFNREGAYTVLSTEGEQSNTTLHTSADKFSINGDIKGYALVLSSSTANSPKKFRITVDDSGTISATEVT